MHIHTMIHDSSRKILCIDDIQIHFDSFKQENTGVQLLSGGDLVAYLYFDQATEFYKAWRAM